MIDSLYEAWRRQDVTAVLALCARDICYVVHEPPGISGVGGCMLGRDEVRDYLQAVVRTWLLLEVKPGHYHVSGNEVRELMWFRARHRDTGEVLKSRKRHVWTVARGLVSQCQEFQDAPSIHAFLRMVGARQHQVSYRLTTRHG